jgi:hypothetical protein
VDHCDVAGSHDRGTAGGHPGARSDEPAGITAHTSTQRRIPQIEIEPRKDDGRRPVAILGSESGCGSPRLPPATRRGGSPTSSRELRIPLVRDGIERVEERVLLTRADAEDGVGDSNHVLGAVAEMNCPAGGR